MNHDRPWLKSQSKNTSCAGLPLQFYTSFFEIINHHRDHRDTEMRN